MPSRDLTGYCPHCQQQTSQRKRTTNHLLHGLVTLFTCAFWLPVWFLAWLLEAPPSCTRCGLAMREPVGAVRTLAAGAMGAMVLLFVALCTGSYLIAVTHYQDGEPALAALTPSPTPRISDPASSAPVPPIPAEETKPVDPQNSASKPMTPEEEKAAQDAQEKAKRAAEEKAKREAAEKDKKETEEKMRLEQEKAADEARKAEELAIIRLNLIKQLGDAGKYDAAIDRCEKLIKEFPKTKAAQEADQYLRVMKKAKDLPK